MATAGIANSARVEMVEAADVFTSRYLTHVYRNASVEDGWVAVELTRELTDRVLASMARDGIETGATYAEVTHAEAAYIERFKESSVVAAFSKDAFVAELPVVAPVSIEQEAQDVEMILKVLREQRASAPDDIELRHRITTFESELDRLRSGVQTSGVRLLSRKGM